MKQFLLLALLGMPGWAAASDASAPASHAAADLDALVPALADPKTKAAAWAELGDALAARELPYAALLAWSEAVAAGNPAPVASALPVAAEVGDEARLAEALLAGKPKLDGEVAARAALVLARHHITERRDADALAALGAVPEGTPAYTEALVLKGVVLNQQGKPLEALAPLLSAQALATDPDLRERATLNLARTFYAADNFTNALVQYAQVPPESPRWPQATFERAWAQFRLDDASGTIALLMNHQSPFLANGYWPEADLLRIWSLFVMCKFPDARAENEAFAARWRPVRDRIGGLSLTPAQAFAEVGAPSQLPAEIAGRFQADGRLRAARAAVARAEAERAKLGSAPWEATASGLLQARSELRIGQEGGRVLAFAERAHEELGEMLQNAQVNRLDILAYEESFYERAVRTGETDFGDTLGQLRKLRKRPDQRLWPFEGEYWADELGHYAVLSRPDCPEDLRAGP